MKQVDPIQDPAAEEVTVEQEGRLSRWSRRKQASRVLENVPESPASNANTGSGTDGQVLQSLTDEDMPPLEILTEESDYTGFLSPKVSDELRKLALRKLFHSSRFNICDGLDDYDDDFTKFAKLGDIITADMRQRAEMEALKKMQQQGEESQVDEAPPARDAQESADHTVDAGPGSSEETVSAEDGSETSI